MTFTGWQVFMDFGSSCFDIFSQKGFEIWVDRQHNFSWIRKHPVNCAVWHRLSVVSKYEYEYEVVFGQKRSYSYCTCIKIRVDTTLYKYDLVWIRAEKIQQGRISYILVLVSIYFPLYSYRSYWIRPRIRYDLIRPSRISDPCYGWLIFSI